MSKSFECCRYCVAPKRHAGCHITCQEYLDAKAEHERNKEIEDMERVVRQYNCDRSNRWHDTRAKTLQRMRKFGGKLT
jgi:hypothetical protein